MEMLIHTSTMATGKYSRSMLVLRINRYFRSIIIEEYPGLEEREEKKSFLSLSSNELYLDISLDHFRLEKESSMLADCQRLVEIHQPLDQADKYGITLVNSFSFLIVMENLFFSYISLQLKPIEVSFDFF